MATKRPEVSIVQRVVPSYRAEFFQRLRSELDTRSIDLRLIVGDGGRRDGGSSVPPSWAEVATLREVSVRGSRIQFHHVIRATRKSDLIVAEQASKSLHTLLQLLAQQFGGPKVALWGHGVNLQTSRRNASAERAKMFMTARAHWFFAYTPGTGEMLEQMGFDADRIQVLHNSTDTVPLRTEVLRLRAQSVPAPNQGLFVGRLYDLKRPDFLLDASEHIRRRIPGFKLSIIGVGPLADHVRQRADGMAGVEFLGELVELELAAPLAGASVMLLPGMVGLAAVDSIAAEVPAVVIQDQEHSPEFEYFQDGKTALVLPRDTTARQYADAVCELLESATLLAKMRDHCAVAAPTLTIDQMVTEFADGICAALSADRRSQPARLDNEVFGL